MSMRDDNEQTLTVFLMTFQGQKRNSIDAGVQTEALAGAAAAEKSKWNQNRHQSLPPCTDLLCLPSASPPSSLSHLNFSTWITLTASIFVTLQSSTKVSEWRNDVESVMIRSSLLIYFIDINVSTSVTGRRHLMRLLRSFKLTYWGYAIDTSTLCF